MNQSIGYEISAVMGAVNASGLLTSLCNIQEPNGLSTSSGAPSGQYTTVTGLGAVPCKDAPPSTAGAHEYRNPAEVESDADRRVLLDGYYPTVIIGWRLGWRAVIDTTMVYDIMGVESDSHRTQTKLRLRRVTV